jgi:hypothetical protein
MSEVGGLSLLLADARTGAELSEHPSRTNAKLANNNRATDRIFMALPFLLILV